jgi:hypothetical protein
VPVNELPRRVVHIDFGDGPKHPTVTYTAPPDVIARFVTALKQWNPEYKVQVEPIADPQDVNATPMPMWRLWAWE